MLWFVTVQQERRDRCQYKKNKDIFLSLISVDLPRMHSVQSFPLLSVNSSECAIAALPVLMYGKENGDSIATKELVI